MHADMYPHESHNVATATNHSHKGKSGIVIREPSMRKIPLVGIM